MNSIINWIKSKLRKIPYHYRKDVHVIIKYFWLFRPVPEAGKKFIVYGCGRSGSTLLSSLLSSHPDIFVDGEILHESRVNQVRFPMLYMNNLSKKASLMHKSVYGCGIMSRHLNVQISVDHEGFLKKLQKKGWYIIHIRRKNILDLVISRNIAEQDKIWELKSQNMQDQKMNMTLDKEDVYRHVWAHNRQYQLEDDMLKEIPHITVYYEDDLESGANWNTKMNEIANIFGVTNFEPTTDLVKKSRGHPQDYILNYQEIVGHLDSHGIRQNKW